MCLAKAYFKDREAEPVLEDIAVAETRDGKLLLRTLFGEQKEIEATIREIDFRKSTIVLESSA